MSLKVISGGQTGVDQAGLAAAKAAGLPTGGWMPRGWLTLEGARDDFQALYSMVECPAGGLDNSDAYRERTHCNVRDSDGTIRIARTFSSPGERCTLIAIHQLNKPHLDISWRAKGLLPQTESVVDWLISNHINVINIAGNAEKTAPGIYDAAYDFLLVVFRKWLVR